MAVLTYVLSVLAACANAVASVLQRKANREVPVEFELKPQLITQLLRRPVWVAGVLGVIAGFLLQAAALHRGQLSVVAPILAFELPLTLMIAARVFHAPLRHREWAACLGMSAGLAAVLYFLAPSSGPPGSVPWQVWLMATGATEALTLAAFEWARRGDIATDQRVGSARRAAGFGLAAGCQFGMTAAFVKAMTLRLGHGIGAVLTGWEVYAMAVSGLVAMFLLQSAMHAGRLIAAQPALTLADPLVSVMWAVAVFGERVRGGTYLLLAMAGGALLVFSVLVLARSDLLGDGDLPSVTPSRDGHRQPGER
ncbi:DMT family transporter [Streptomyces luomodiensis]|uniref:DMT family transporter n=1 Tax=Streptomyces luomodiensis TaxID=3026192 RepID=A0ABY9UQA8_9ACTN|nr:DMT family transporter [Streptomyces sp. SCA4-21]WNE94110.1 DMT family transporter [Streptomyces sp. SCA4-21]